MSAVVLNFMGVKLAGSDAEPVDLASLMYSVQLE